MIPKAKFKKLEEEIKKAKKILLLTHRAPDGDAIGSLLALNLYLREKKKRTYLFSSSLPKHLEFLPGYAKIQKTFPKKNDFDLIIAIDYADAKRIDVPCKFEIDDRKVISIDHHLLLSGKKIGKIKIIDSSASSVSEILYYFFEKTEEEITRDIATCLLMGIFSDTIAFSRLKEKSRKALAGLLEKEGDIASVSVNYSQMSFSQGKILQLVLERLKKYDKIGLIYSWLSFKDFKEIKKSFGEKEKSELYLQEPPVFPDFISHVGNAKIYLFLVEFKNGKIKGSLRSDERINVAKIAERFGGGGHKEASGFFTRGTIQETLKEIKNECKKCCKEE